MIDSYLQGLINNWPIGLQSIGNAMRVVLPVVLICIVVLLLARAIQRWIDRMEATHPAQMRTADAQQIESDVQQLWKRWHDTVPPAAQELQQQRRKVQTGLRTVPPADRPAS